MCLTCVPSSKTRVTLLKSLSALNLLNIVFTNPNTDRNRYYSPCVFRIFRNLLIVFRFCQYFANLTSDDTGETGNLVNLLVLAILVNLLGLVNLMTLVN